MADLQHWTFSRGRFAHGAAWTLADVQARVRQLLDHFADLLPVDPAARIVLKPNLNNDLVALTGNSVDLRVLMALLTALRERGYTDLTVADGSNVTFGMVATFTAAAS